MRILYLGNNLNGYNILKFLVAGKEHIVGLAVHPSEKARYKEEMIDLFKLQPAPTVFQGDTINSLETLNRIKRLKPDLVLSVNFGYILREPFIKIPPRGCINLHTSLLPYNRGSHPNIWSIVDETPAGVTLHYIDIGIDTGNIIDQKEIVVDPADTAESLYRKLEQASLELFKLSWPLIKEGKISGKPQPSGSGTYHNSKEIEKLDQIDLNKSYKAKDLINILRARTFPPYPGAYFKHNGKKIYLRLQLISEEDLQ